MSVLSASGPVFWADTESSVRKVESAIRRAFDRGEPIGLDTEFYGVQVGKQSTYARAKLHFLSVSVKRNPRVLSPRGYDVSDPAVISADCVHYLREVLESPGIKAVHNLPVDAHTLANVGIKLGGGVNTLAMARWAWPSRARGAGFTLDSLGQDFLGTGKTEGFTDIFTGVRTEYRSTFRKTRVCECGESACGRRSTTPGHTRHEEQVETKHPKEVEYDIPLEEVNPGHPLFNRALSYAAQDAVLALGVYDLALLEMNRTTREIPWLD